MLDDVMVRRLKEDLREIVGGFPKREVVQEDIEGLPSDAPELRLVALLDEYRQLREKRLKVPKEIIDLQLGHKVKTPNGTAYDRTAFLDERREMMQKWADFLDVLKAEILQ
jgi:hypothetical protein